MKNKKLSFIAFLAAFLAMALVSMANEVPHFTLWQLPSQGPTQMMSYVVKSSGGKLLVVDGGMTCDGEYLREFLVERGGHVDGWFVTHPYQDHVNALSWILAHPGSLEDRPNQDSSKFKLPQPLFMGDLFPENTRRILHRESNQRPVFPSTKTQTESESAWNGI